MVTTIAFHLPQYHPIPENDEWWGPGFTEWTNVAKARPRFRGHYQPHIPGELGYYDLRLEETREAQAELAKSHRVDAFSYYHYWFDGRQLLERPVNEILRLKRPNHKFVLNWANENWTRTWGGEERSILMGQDPNNYDAEAHLEWLAPAFDDPRYLRVNGKPVWIVYTAANLLDVPQTLERWRKAARKRGFPDLYLAAVMGPKAMTPEQIKSVGFDAAIEFAPKFAAAHRNWKIKALLPARLWNRLASAQPKLHLPYISHLQIYEYKKMVQAAMQRQYPEECVVHPCVFPSWDNSARRPNWAQICQNDDPGMYADWVEHAVGRATKHSPDEQLVFINAWNEWGEGCHLEPDRRNGRMFLEATRDAVLRAEENPKPAAIS